MAVSPLAMVILVAQYLIVIGFLFSAFMFARGKSAEGWKWLENSLVLALAIVVVPGVISMIFTGNPNAGNIINNLAVPNYYVGLDAGYPKVIPGAQASGAYYTTTVTFSYTFGVEQNVKVIGINFGATQGQNQTIILQNGAQMVIPSTITPKYLVVSFTGDKNLNNDKIESGLNKSFTLTDFIYEDDVFELSYSPDNKAHTASFTEYLLVVDTNGNTHTIYEQVYTVVVSASPVKVTGGGSGLGGVIADALAKLVNLIMSIFKFLGGAIAHSMPSISGERAMLMFVLMPTDNMVSPHGAQFVHDFYYNKAIPIGMAILIMTTILAFIESLWNGSGDSVFAIAKKFTGIVIWMLGGYYFYMAFAGFIDGIILYIGIGGVLWFGSLVNSLYGMIILLGIATSMVSNNISGTALGMVLGALYLFMAFAVFKFFIILAVVAMFPIIAAFGMISYGPSMHNVISKVVDMGVFGIVMTATLELLYQANQNGGSIVGSISGMLAIYLLFSPNQIQSFLGGLAQGEHLSFSGITNVAGTVARTGTDSVRAAGLTAAGVGLAAKKTRNAGKPGQTSMKTRLMNISRINRIASRNAPSATKAQRNKLSKPAGAQRNKLSKPAGGGVGAGIGAELGASTQQKEVERQIERDIEEFKEEIYGPSTQLEEPAEFDEETEGSSASLQTSSDAEPIEPGMSFSLSTRSVSNVKPGQKTILKERTDMSALPREESERKQISSPDEKALTKEKPEERLKSAAHPLKGVYDELTKFEKKLEDVKYAIKHVSAEAEMFREKARLEKEKASENSIIHDTLSRLHKVTAGFERTVGGNRSDVSFGRLYNIHREYRNASAKIYEKSAEKRDRKALELTEHFEELKRNLKLKEPDLMPKVREVYANRVPPKLEERFAKEDYEHITKKIETLIDELSKARQEGKSLFNSEITRVGTESIKASTTMRQRIMKSVDMTLKGAPKPESIAESNEVIYNRLHEAHLKLDKIKEDVEKTKEALERANEDNEVD